MATFTIDEAVNGGKKTFSVAEAYGNAAPDSPNPLWDALKSLPSSAARAGAGIVGFPQVLGDLADRAATKLTNLVGYDQDKSPVFGAIDRFVGNKLGINLKDSTPISQQMGIPNLGDVSLRGNKQLMGLLYHEPQTALGRIADFTAQNVLSGGTSKRGLLQSIAQGGAGGILGEVGDTLLGTPGRVAGQMLGVMGAGALPSLRGTAGSVAKDALEGVTENQLAQAKALMDDAARMGTPLTVPEAVAQITGGNPLQQVQRWAEQAPKGRQAFDPMMNARPAANRAAFGNAADQISPLPVDRGSTPANLANAASAAITKARQAGNKAAYPFYDVARTQKIPANQWNALTQDPAIQKALQAVKGNPVYRVGNSQPGSVEWLDAAKKWADDASSKAIGSGENNAAAVWGGAAKTITQTVDASVPTYAKARGIVAKNFRDVVEPMQNSPVGGVADSMPRGTAAETGLAAQSRVFMPPSPGTTTPASIRQAAMIINKQNPSALGDFTRQNLERIFNEKSQDLVTGEAQGGAAKFAADISGNEAQRANLQALVESTGDKTAWTGLQSLVESTGGKTAWTGFNRLLDVFNAQGKRLAPGSPTEANRLLTGEMTSNWKGIADKPLEMLNRWRVRSNAEALGNLFTDLNGIEKLKQLAFTNPNTAKRTLLVGEILGIMNPVDPTNAETIP